MLLQLANLELPDSVLADSGLVLSCMSTHDAEILMATNWAARLGWSSTKEAVKWTGVSCSGFNLSMYVVDSRAPAVSLESQDVV